MLKLALEKVQYMRYFESSISIRTQPYKWEIRMVIRLNQQHIISMSSTKDGKTNMLLVQYKIVRLQGTHSIEVIASIVLTRTYVWWSPISISSPMTKNRVHCIYVHCISFNEWISLKARTSPRFKTFLRVFRWRASKWSLVAKKLKNRVEPSRDGRDIYELKEICIWSSASEEKHWMVIGCSTTWGRRDLCVCVGW